MLPPTGSRREIMTEVEILEVCRQAVYVLLAIISPVMLIGLGVGLVIALFQALTQIQEMTLAFVPKILVVFISLIVLAPFMLRQLFTFTLEIADKIIALP